MRLSEPVDLVVTSVMQMLQGTQVVSAIYLLVVNMTEEVGWMTTNLRITDREGVGVNIAASLDGSQLIFQSLADTDPERQGRSSELGRILVRSSGLKVRPIFLGTHCPANICSGPDQRFQICPTQGYAVEVSHRGNLVCPHCLRRHQLGTAMEATEPCLCGRTLPALRIPFHIPPP